MAYVVLALAFVFEDVSSLQALRQTRREAMEVKRSLLQHALETSDPTLRAVFAEDSAALVGLVIAFAGVLAHDLTGSPVPDAVGSIVVGVLLGVIAAVLIDRNRRYLVGVEVSAPVRQHMMDHLSALPGVARVNYLHMEFVGPRRVFLVAGVDLRGDEAESSVAAEARRLERQLEEAPFVVEAVLTVSRSQDDVAAR